MAKKARKAKKKTRKKASARSSSNDTIEIIDTVNTRLRELGFIEVSMPGFKEKDLEVPFDITRLSPQMLGQILLTPTRIYARPIVKVLRHYRVKKVISGMAHITGGGLPGNVNRALPDDVDAKISLDAWEVPPIFPFLQKHGNVEEDEMFRVFNMGIGYVLIVRPTFADSIVRQLNRLGENAFVIGGIVKGKGNVRLE